MDTMEYYTIMRWNELNHTDKMLSERSQIREDIT